MEEMDEEPVLSRDATEVLEQLGDVQERIQELKDERTKLLEANQALVQLVTQLEDKLEEFMNTEEAEDVETEQYVYSFTEGWRSKDTTQDDSLTQPDAERNDDDFDVESIEDQIQDVEDAMRKLKRRHA